MKPNHTGTHAVATDLAIDNANVHGVRVTPHLFTAKSELDTFVRVMKAIAKG